MKMWISAAMFCGAALLVGCGGTAETPSETPAETPEVTLPAESTEAPATPAAEDKPMEEAKPE
ncbi:hypothetical protein [Blastopirellula marina]|uniref:Uncharacterized protein n=1 Tax=Blastopirellula marina DSM 3645 TaxID=314230 RepID=A3ZPX2_9BACT|nr:hypothetical protein [Blastopirellula marina]EAQ81245.1 hypothetical protein DSM3645_22676 [Blastopirellula marina DSM 3645]